MKYSIWSFFVVLSLAVGCSKANLPTSPSSTLFGSLNLVVSTYCQSNPGGKPFSGGELQFDPVKYPNSPSTVFFFWPECDPNISVAFHAKLAPPKSDATLAEAWTGGNAQNIADGTFPGMDGGTPQTFSLPITNMDYCGQTLKAQLDVIRIERNERTGEISYIGTWQSPAYVGGIEVDVTGPSCTRVPPQTPPQDPPPTCKVNCDPPPVCKWLPILDGEWEDVPDVNSVHPADGPVCKPKRKPIAVNSCTGKKWYERKPC